MDYLISNLEKSFTSEIYYHIIWVCVKVVKQVELTFH